LLSWIDFRIIKIVFNLIFMKIVLSWIQWSWKWTQARILQKKYNFKIFDTGANIRQIAQEDSEIWREVKQRIDNWILVPLEILQKILTNFLTNQASDTNIIFDWVPRSLEQKDFFDNIVWDFKIIHLNLPKVEAENRVIWRKICFSCQATYPKDYEHKFCEKCSWKIWVRIDDSDDKALQKRIDIFVNETIPVIESYKKEWKVIEVDASKDIIDIALEIENKLWLSYINKNRIRELESNTKDIVDLIELYKTLWDWYEVSEKNIYLISRSPRDFLFWYEMDNKIVWSVSLSICLNACQKPRALIDNFCVLEQYRWIWIGRALLEEIERTAKMFDCYKIEMLSNKTHIDTHNAYKKFWFDSDIAVWLKKYL